MRVLWIFPCVIALAGCANPYAKAREARLQAAHYEALTVCDQAGQTDEWKSNCYKAVTTRREVEYQTAMAQQQAQTSNALLIAGANGLINPQVPQVQPIQQPTHCSTRRIAGSLETRCQ